MYRGDVGLLGVHFRVTTLGFLRVARATLRFAYGTDRGVAMDLLLTRLARLKREDRIGSLIRQASLTFIGGGCCRNADRSAVEPMPASGFGTCALVAADWLVADDDTPVEIELAFNGWSIC